MTVLDIRKVIQELVVPDLQTLKEGLDEMKTDMRVVRDDLQSVKADVKVLSARTDGVEKRMDGIEKLLDMMHDDFRLSLNVHERLAALEAKSRN